jgi:formate hydrogenlyase transcriptional activator
MTAPSSFDTEPSRRLEALLEVSRTLAAYQEFGELLGALDACLRKVVEYDRVVLMLYDADAEHAWICYPGAYGDRINNVVAFPFIDGPGYLVWKHQQPLVKSLADLARDHPKIFAIRQRQGMRSTCTVPLTTVHRQLGVMEFATSRAETYVAEDVHFMQLVAAQVATAVDNAFVYARVRASEENLAIERDHFRTLLEVTNVAVSRLDTSELVEDISVQIDRLIGAAFCGLVIYEPFEDQLRWETVHFTGGRGLVQAGRVAPLSGAVVARAYRERATQTLSQPQMEALTASNGLVHLLLEEGIRAVCALPLISRDATIGVLVVGHCGREAFSAHDIRFLEEIAGQVSMSVANTLAYREINSLRDKLASEKLYLEEEIRAHYNFDEIIGKSDQLKAVLGQVQMVAGSDASVLILGETGTGKDLIARAIHNLSARKGHTLVKVNCAAIPSDLLESDLFGHERGAFTGAIGQKIGRFELAHQGTIFLDEIGDFPLDLQPKLLRVLQEREIERLGSTRAIHVDARVISATNRNLPQMIADRHFRSDLYYRLNVFPIHVPPLRERREDIPLLVNYFVQKFAKKMQRDITLVPSAAMDALVNAPWPGNVRELQHLMERAVIITRGSTLQVPLEGFGVLTGPSSAKTRATARRLSTLDDFERNHILNTLRDTNGQIGGPDGAAARLGLKRTTLLSKMKRLGIMRESASAVFRTRH